MTIRASSIRPAAGEGGVIVKDASEETVQPTSGRSRRELLAGAAWSARHRGGRDADEGRARAGRRQRPGPVLGTANSESHRTWIDKIGQDGYAVFQGNSTGSDPGLVGFSPAGIGVYGVGGSGTGVYGQSGSTLGATPDQSGVHGVSDANGYSGVYGEFLGTGVGAAVHGNNLTGTGQGVVGFGATGVEGLATSGGTGVVALSAFDGTGLALNARGRPSSPSAAWPASPRAPSPRPSQGCR